MATATVDNGVTLPSPHVQCRCWILTVGAFCSTQFTLTQVYLQHGGVDLHFQRCKWTYWSHCTARFQVLLAVIGLF